MKNREIEKILKALGNRRRLAIVKYLKKNTKAPVGDIAHAINLSFRSTSKHLVILAATDIVEKEQRGTHMLYSLFKTQKLVIRAIVKLV